MIIIRESSVDDAIERGLVHYKAWIETYTNLIDDIYLKEMKVEDCINAASKYAENTLVAQLNNKIVGFVCYDQCRDDNMNDYGEITALYVLKDYQKQGFGKMLVDACLEKLNIYNKFCLWVLDTNYNAINFYKKLGFQFNGDKKEEILVTPITELRMVR